MKRTNKIDDGPERDCLSTPSNRRYREFNAPHGKVQVVEIAEGQCQVAYLPSKASEDWSGKGWQHWGLGEGGYKATCKRFADCSTFNPDKKGEA